MKLVLLLLLAHFKSLFAAYQTDDLISKALLENPSIQATASSIDEKNSIVNFAKSKFVPNATLSLSTFCKDPMHWHSKETKDNFSQAKLLITQKIFDPSSIVEHKLAKVQKEISCANKGLEELKIRQEIETLFPKVWLEQERKTLIDQLWQAAKLELKRDTKRAKLGLLSHVQVASSLAKFNESKKQVLKYPDNLEKAFCELQKAVGTQIYGPENYPKLLLAQEEITIKPVDFYLEKALENRQEIEVAKHQIDLEEKNSALALSGYLPTISGQTSVEGQNHHYFDRKSHWNGQIGLCASWNFFDGGGHKFQRDAALARKFRAEENLELLKIKIGAQTNNSFQAVQEKLKDLDCAEQKFNEQKAIFNKKKAEFRLGLISKHEMEQATLNWLKVKFDWLEVKTDLKIAKKQLDLGCGSSH